MRVFRFGGVCVVVLALGMLGGCARLNQMMNGPATTPAGSATASAQPAAAAPSPVLSFVVSAADGDQTSVADPYFGGQVSVTMDTEYYSASGLQCRRFTVRPSNSAEKPQPFTACVVNGAWSMAGMY